MKTRAAICLPDYGFDPTEAAVPYEYLTQKGWEIDVVTEKGKEPQCDQRMISGPVGALLGAKAPAKKAYALFSSSSAFKSPKAWSDAAFELMAYDVVILPGGHDKGVKQIIESEGLGGKLADFWKYTRESEEAGSTKKVCAAICHGVMVLAWAKDENTGKSLLYDRRTTTLPEHLERMAHVVTAPVLGDYYRTYPCKYTAGLVTEALRDPSQFEPGPWNLTASDAPSAAHVVRDERYISARWPGDAQAFSEAIYDEAVKAGLA